MRIDQKLEAIRAASDDSGRLWLETTQFYGGQAYRVENWTQLSGALAVLLEQNWPRVRWPDQTRWLDDFMELNPGEDAPLLEVNQFNELEAAVNLFRDLLPVAIDVMASQVPAYEPQTIFIDIGRLQTFDDLEDAVRDLKRLFDLMSIDGGFSFVGVAQGSDWISVIPWGEIAIAAYHITLILMDKYIAIRGGKTDDDARAEIEASRKMSGDDAPVTPDHIQEYLTLLTESKMDPDWDEVDRYLDQAVRTPTDANEARNKLKRAVTMMHDQTKKGRIFYPALVPPPNIIIPGDNNHITINYVQSSNDRLPLELHSGDSEETSDSDVSADG
jgi:hypothetical protein